MCFWWMSSGMRIEGRVPRKLPLQYHTLTKGGKNAKTNYITQFVILMQAKITLCTADPSQAEAPHVRGFLQVRDYR